MKPQIDYEIIMITLHLKPWKGRINDFIVPIHSSGKLSDDIRIAIDRVAPNLKRRTLKSVEINYRHKF